MLADESELGQLMGAILRDHDRAKRLLASRPDLALARLERGAERATATDFFLDDIGHYVYAGDSALHVAAAGCRAVMARLLVSAGADVRARNRRGAEPLHYAADGAPGGPHWNPAAQAATITYLIEAGADPAAVDRSGVAPLHRAVRTRSAAAVNALLVGGADPGQTNKSGSTPMKLAVRSTGRGGSGSTAALAEQAEIIRLLLRYGAAPA